MTTERDRLRALWVTVLAIAALTLVFWALSYERAVQVMQYYAGPLALVFFGRNLQSGVYRERGAHRVGLMFVAWFVLSRVVNGELYLQNSWWHVSSLCITYLLALPFAASMQDGRRRRGLTCVAWIFSVAYACLAWLSVYAIIRGRNIVLPVLDTMLGTDYGRLLAGQHPNGSATLFLMGFLLTLYLVAHYRKRWLLLPAAVMCLGFYVGTALSVSRTVMVEMSLAVGAIAFLFLMRANIRRVWLRAAAALAAFVVAFGLCYAGFGGAVNVVNSMNQKHLLPAAGAEEMLPAQPEKAPKPTIQARPMDKDITSLTGRTDIWQAGLSALKDDPSILAFGLLDSEFYTRVKPYAPMQISHIHNAYLETLLITGLPGLMMALWFTFLALRMGLRILLIHARKAAWTDQLLALIPLVLLVNCMTESVLFVETFTYANFVFFLCLGYLEKTEQALLEQKASR